VTIKELIQELKLLATELGDDVEVYSYLDYEYVPLTSIPNQNA